MRPFLASVSAPKTKRCKTHPCGRKNLSEKDEPERFARGLVTSHLSNTLRLPTPTSSVSPNHVALSATSPSSKREQAQCATLARATALIQSRRMRTGIDGQLGRSCKNHSAIL